MKRLVCLCLSNTPALALVGTQLVMRDYPLSAELIKERAAHRARSLQVRIGKGS